MDRRFYILNKLNICKAIWYIITTLYQSGAGKGSNSIIGLEVGIVSFHG